MNLPLASIPALAPGVMLGRYRVDELLARGGMGEVWLATATGPGGFRKRVVLKTVRTDLAEDPSYVDMLVNEAALSARLDHPNIVQVFDLGCADGVHFICMEYLVGRTLTQLMKRLDGRGERMPAWLAMTIAAAVCDALQHAHDCTDDDGKRLGILHRDISPSNVMVSFAGRVAVLDFGVATALHRKGSTGARTVKGKFSYMAPERLTGAPADRRSDIYSVGVLLYQMLAWRRPFRHKNEFELCKEVLRGGAPPPSTYGSVPPELDRIVGKAMAHSPDDRYGEARLMAEDLRALLRRDNAVVETSDVAAVMRSIFQRRDSTRTTLDPSAQASRLFAALPDIPAPATDEPAGLATGLLGPPRGRARRVITMHPREVSSVSVRARAGVATSAPRCRAATVPGTGGQRLPCDDPLAFSEQSVSAAFAGIIADDVAARLETYTESERASTESEIWLHDD